MPASLTISLHFARNALQWQRAERRCGQYLHPLHWFPIYPDKWKEGKLLARRESDASSESCGPSVKLMECGSVSSSHLQGPERLKTPSFTFCCSPRPSSDEPNKRHRRPALSRDPSKLCSCVAAKGNCASPLLRHLIKQPIVRPQIRSTCVCVSHTTHSAPMMDSVMILPGYHNPTRLPCLMHSHKLCRCGGVFSVRCHCCRWFPLGFVAAAHKRLR